MIPWYAISGILTDEASKPSTLGGILGQLAEARAWGLDSWSVVCRPSTERGPGERGGLGGIVSSMGLLETGLSPALWTLEHSATQMSGGLCRYWLLLHSTRLLLGLPRASMSGGTQISVCQ